MSLREHKNITMHYRHMEIVLKASLACKYPAANNELMMRDTKFSL